MFITIIIVHLRCIVSQWTRPRIRWDNGASANGRSTMRRRKSFTRPRRSVRGIRCTLTSRRSVSTTGSRRRRVSTRSTATAFACFRWPTTWTRPITRSSRRWCTTSIPLLYPSRAACPPSSRRRRCSIWTTTKSWSWKSTTTWSWRSAGADRPRRRRMKIRKSSIGNWTPPHPGATDPRRAGFRGPELMTIRYRSVYVYTTYIVITVESWNFLFKFVFMLCLLLVPNAQ